jgi:NAD(P)-dependent dehydrogenase (short-subunit alcohol dehydrogenase family)
VGEAPGLSSAIEAALSSHEFRVRQILPGSRNRSLGNHRYEVDLSSPEAVQRWHASVVGEGTVVGAVFNFLGLAERFARPGCHPQPAPLELALGLFNLFKQVGADLRQSAKRDGGWAFNFTSLGGKFGVGASEPLPVAQAPTIGMFKTLKREWPELFVKTLDLDLTADSNLLFSQLIDEITTDDGQVEIGLDGSNRWRIALNDQPGTETLNSLALDSASVVLITGGAYGVTADVAKALACQARPRLILVGRSPLPDAEPEETRMLTDVAALRRHLITTMRAQSSTVLPAEIERSLSRILKDRQIRANLAAMQQAGATVEYHSVDVRHAEQFGALLDDLYARWGRIDGVIHGAGVIEDTFISRKTPQSFANVFSTKVDSALILAHKLRPERLQFLVFFSSVAGRFGNLGQIDYSAANEYLNKLADHLARQWPGRVVAVNWGPWDAGMISDELRRLYRARGVAMIPVDEGARLFLDELRRGKQAPAEVVIACSLNALATSAPLEASQT